MPRLNTPLEAMKSVTHSIVCIKRWKFRLLFYVGETIDWQSQHKCNRLCSRIEQQQQEIITGQQNWICMVHKFVHSSIHVAFDSTNSLHRENYHTVWPLN